MASYQLVVTPMVIPTANHEQGVYDERGLEGWMGRTLKALHSGFVTRRRPLEQLLSEAHPTSVTQEGEAHEFDREELQRWASHATPEEAHRLRLPLTLNFDADLPDSCFIDDDVGGEVLRRMENFGRAYPWREGRMWLPHSLGLELLGRYPTTLQRLFR